MLLFAIVAQLQVATAARVELVSKTDRLVTGQAITVQLQVHDGEVRRPPTLVTDRGLDAQGLRGGRRLPVAPVARVQAAVALRVSKFLRCSSRL